MTRQPLTEKQKIGGGLLVALLIVVFISFRFNSSSSRHSGYDIEIGPNKLLAAYKQNEVSADNKYKGKLLNVTGTIDTIGKDILDNPYVTFATGEEYALVHIQCVFSDSKGLASLRPGQEVTIIGTGSGKFGNVLLKDCHVVP